MSDFWGQVARGAARRNIRGRALIALGMAATVLTAGCGASPTGGPDPAVATFFKATMVEGGPLPYRFLLPGDLGDTYLTDARLVPLDLGRTTDVRIFEDRGGSGSSGGNTRDTTVSTGRMADVRYFAASPGSSATQVDSVAVDVVRVGDMLYITRPHPDPARSRTDTAQYFSGVLVRRLSYWRDVNEVRMSKALTYTTVR